ncbi:MAG: ATP-binding protein [Bacteroidales bacterium]
MNYILRKNYLERVRLFMYKNLIKVFVGQRRVGKSTILLQVKDIISKEKPDSNIIFVNKEDLSFDHIKNYNDLVSFCEARSNKNKMNFLFIDEIQDIENFEKALRHFQTRDNWDIYITGSNAKLLSGELATFISGRYIEIKIHSLSYSEFLVFQNLENRNESLLKYIRYGGLPYLKNLELKDEIIFDYLKNIYAAILYKDIISRHNIRNTGLLDKLILFIADNTGSIVSAKRITDFLKSQKVTISHNLILDYLNYLCEAFFLYKIKRNDLKGRKILEFGEKYYFEDLGIRHAIRRYKDEDINKIIENAVFNHLIANGYEVTTGKIGDREIDFVAEKTNTRLYLQVAFTIPDDRVKEREFGNLLQIKDNYRKMVISLDEIQLESYKGVEHWHLRKFLTEFK